MPMYGFYWLNISRVSLQPTCSDRNVVANGTQDWSCPEGYERNNATLVPGSNENCCLVSDSLTVRAPALQRAQQRSAAR
jgi:hypothetical protein